MYCIQDSHLWIPLDMDISMYIHVKSVDMDMDVKIHIHGNPVKHGPSQCSNNCQKRAARPQWRQARPEIDRERGITKTI